MNSRASERAARDRLAKGGGYFAEEDRAQRNTLALRDVAYVLRADVDVLSGTGDDPAKFRDQFRRRVQRGQCFHQPYLGCREFTAFFSPAAESDRPADVTLDLGRMLFDLEYGGGQKGEGTPIFFEARLNGGVLHVPAQLYGTGG